MDALTTALQETKTRRSVVRGLVVAGAAVVSGTMMTKDAEAAAAPIALNARAVIEIKNQNIALDFLSRFPDSRVKSVTFEVYLAPHEVDNASLVSVTDAYVTSVQFFPQTGLRKGEIRVRMLVTTKNPADAYAVFLAVQPIEGGPYTFERVVARGTANQLVRVSTVK